MVFDALVFVYGVALTVAGFTFIQQLSPENVVFKFSWEIPPEPRKKGSYFRACFVAVIVYVIGYVILSLAFDTLTDYNIAVIEIAIGLGFIYWSHIDRLVTLKKVAKS